MATTADPRLARNIARAEQRKARAARVEAFRLKAQERGVTWLRPILKAHGVELLSMLPDAAIDAALQE